MPLDYTDLTSMPPIETQHRFDERDTMLYALGIGAGLTAGDDFSEQHFVYEASLQALPTMAVVLAYPGFWSRDPKYGITWQKLLHVEQEIELHADLPVAGNVLGKTRIDEIYDRGADKGALMQITRHVTDMATGALLATVKQVNLLRADGGFGGPSYSALPPVSPPDRVADKVVTLPTRSDQALLYRLSGDMNPLHADPAAAARAGFPQPILHGLASYGIAGRAVLRAACDNDPKRLKRLGTRFSSPVFPGETIETRVWIDGSGGFFESRVVERDVVVMKNGSFALNA